MILGQYYIDPNEGDIKDAILVHCDMEKKASCILPKPEKTPTINYKGRNAEIWLADVQGGMKVSRYGLKNITDDSITKLIIIKICRLRIKLTATKLHSCNF